MTGLLIILVAGLLLVSVGTVYSRFLSRNFGEEPSRPTPAMLKNDGRDYVPTPTLVVFGHHFAAIAGAGPILGPVLALCYGWGPAICWVILGGLFIGAVHDYLATFMATREGGQSMATIARRMLGRGPFIVLMLFLILMLGLVTATFLNTSATALVSKLDMGRMRLAEGQTLFRVVEEGGRQKVIIGGIASMSVVILTIAAPIIGWMYIKKGVSALICSVASVIVCGLSIVVGLYHPIALSEYVHVLGFQIHGTELWKFLLAAYVLLAAGAPVWMFLQSRDFINAHILYGGIFALVLTLVVAGIRGGSVATDAAPMPLFDAVAGRQYLGLFWPALFITIACGAISGFHSLCAGGTTSKQLKSERATRYVGYWAMLLESMLAATVIAVLVVGATRANYLADVFTAANPVLGFAAAVGEAGHIAFGLPVAAGALAGMLLLEGFVVTTLDAAVRLNRYLIEETWLELFGKYDVFADHRATKAPAAATSGNAVGAGGIPTAVTLPPQLAPRRPIPTAGAQRWLLGMLRHYWVNSGLAVLLMLLLAFSGGILQLWQIFATSNQLLAAFVLGLGSIWLLRRGSRAWFVVGPAIFMLATTCASLIQLVFKFLPRTVDGVPAGNRTLFIADLVLIALTAYLIVAAVRELMAMYRRGFAVIPATEAAA
jgi:carbon starvation protein